MNFLIALLVIIVYVFVGLIVIKLTNQFAIDTNYECQLGFGADKDGPTAVLVIFLWPIMVVFFMFMFALKAIAYPFQKILPQIDKFLEKK